MSPTSALAIAALLPHQFYRDKPNVRKRFGRIPVDEKVLWLGVLIQSAVDLVGINLPENRVRENKHRRSAREWFEGAGDEEGSFEWTCYVLGLHADGYRRRVF